jgi:uncharacterized protein
MLIEFKVSNYRSIGEEQVISLLPAPKQKDFLENIIIKDKYEALNAISFYGPNGGGKSNILRAMSLLDRLVHLSARSSSISKLPYDPFLLREGWNEKSTTFEISFVVEDQRYRYGLAFNENAILEENLSRKNKGREVNLFQREGEVIDVGPGFRGAHKVIDAAVEATRPNSLFLSTCDMFNLEEAKKIMQWFKHFNMVDGLYAEDDIRTVTLAESQEYQQRIKLFLQNLDLGLQDIEINSNDFEESDLPADITEDLKNELSRQLKGSKTYVITGQHKVYARNGQATGKLHSWDFNDRESAGSQKALKLSGPIVWALMNGGVLIIDELEAAMHPLMTLQTIELFLDQKTNPKQAQLIFATHDTNLLSYAKLRRDQICFVQKNAWESTEIYALSDFVYFGEKNGKPISEKERPDSDKEKRYFEGRYQAIPNLKQFKEIMALQN